MRRISHQWAGGKVHGLDIPVCKLWQAPYRDSLSIWNFLPDTYLFIPYLTYIFLSEIYLTEIILLEILPYQFLFSNARKLYFIKVSVNRLYVDMT